MSNKNYSTIFPNKLPAFIRDDPAYSRFIDFFQAYYNWFDDTYNVYGFGDNLDIDSGFEYFYAYYAQDFLPYFPDIDTIAADKVKLIKIVKELYKAKGVPDSFKFLFRALYNVDAEVVPTSQFVFKPSDGKWLVPKSIKIKSLDTNFLNIDNFKVFGEISKSIGLIEKSVVNDKFIQIYLSNIQRLFMSGEPIKILDYDNKDVYFLNGKYVQYDKEPPIQSVKLESKIIGSISNITIDAKRRGRYYKVGDPVVITGGLNIEVDAPIGAVATVSEVTTGQILNAFITADGGGYGYRTFPNSSIDIIQLDGTVDSNANCIISFVDELHPANVAYVCNDCIENQLFVQIGANTLNFSSNTANANTQLINFLSFTQFFTYPIAAITVRNGGGGYDAEPTLRIHSNFSLANSATNYQQNLQDLGILAPIEIVNPGRGYYTNNTITISGGDGAFAYARINSVNGYGSITGVEYYYNANSKYALGGMGYNNDNLPIVTVNTSTGSNASLIIPSILSTGAKYTLESDKIGAITKITVSENGEDYITAPNVSLRIQDIIVTSNNISNIAAGTSTIYQGTYEAQVFSASIASINPIYFDPLTNYQLFVLRIYDYIGNLSANTELYAYNNDSQTSYTLSLDTSYNPPKFINGMRTYGDGSATATSKFLNGLIQDQGRYINSDGQPSAYSCLQGDVYNLSTYILSTEKDYNSYKDVVNDLLHPVGNRLITRNLLKSNSQYAFSSNSVMQTTTILSNVSSLIIQNIDSYYSNTVEIYVSANTDISSIFSVNTKIYIEGPTNLNVCSIISSVNNDSNLITLNDGIQYKYPNIYYGYTQANSIIITNDNNYNDTKYSVNTFISIGDSITTPNNAAEIIVGITNNILYFTNILNPSGNSSNSENITVVKELSSNIITIYTTV